jgi:putative transposase
MGQSRKVVPGTTYLITRRCLDRRFYLRPDAITTRIIAYCLARAARITGVKVHAICVMSNHIHLVVTDVRGLLPEFSARLFREIALCIKAHHGVRERVWRAGSYSAVELVTERAVVGKIVYTLANPVTAGLVRTAKEWPGLISLPGAMYGTVTLEGERPTWFDDKQTDVERIKLCAPPCFEGRDLDELVSAIKDELEAREKSAAAELRKTGRKVLGADRVRNTDPFDGEWSTLEGEGMVMGLMPNVTYEQQEIQLMPGDVVAIFSDGIPESENATEQEFGETRLAELLTANATKPLAEIVSAVTDAVDAWAHDLAARDDTTIVVMRRL